MGTGRSIKTLEKVNTDFQAQNSINSSGKIIPIECDHSDDKAVEDVFKNHFSDGIDVLINNAYAAVTALMQPGVNRFWEIDPGHWDQVNNVGLRNHYRCSVFATRIMIEKGIKNGLIVTVSSAGGAIYLPMGVAYCVGKEAKDRLAIDMAFELRKVGIYSVSLWPGAVRTELIEKEMLNTTDPRAKGLQRAFKNGETPYFSGRCLAAVLKNIDDKRYMKEINGKIVQTCDIAAKHGISDADGRVIKSMFCISSILSQTGYETFARFVPSFIRIPKWLFVFSTFKKR